MVYCAFTDGAVKRDRKAVQRREGIRHPAQGHRGAKKPGSPQGPAPTQSGCRPNGQGAAHMVRAPPIWSGHRPHGQGTAHLVRAPPTWSGL